MVSSIGSGGTFLIALTRMASRYELQRPDEGGPSVVPRARRGEFDARRNHHLPDRVSSTENISYRRARPVDERSGRTRSRQIKEEGDV
jgi:hypothetical protein